MARDRKSSQRRRASPQPGRGRPNPAAGKPPVGPDSAGAVEPSVSEPAGAVEPSVSEPAAVKPSVSEPAGAVKPSVSEPAGAARAPVVPEPAEPAEDGVLGDATVDELVAGDESVIAALEPADRPVGAVPTDPPMLPPVELTDGGPAEPGEFSSTRERLAANRLDESDEILPAARRTGRPPAKVGGNKVTSFLRASWAELQRVQWPDRRQVGQATAVVLGFVAIAGGFLALTNLLGSDLVNALL